jgi:hypothetical protein
MFRDHGKAGRDGRGAGARAVMPARAGLGRVLRTGRRRAPGFHPGHPLGCHRRRVPGRVVFEHVVAALVHGSGYQRIATPGCPDPTIGRRLAQWAQAGIAAALHAAALRAYDQIIGLELGDAAMDGCLAKAPCGGERAGPSPVGRRKGGLKRKQAASQLIDTLVLREYLERRVDPGDRRRMGVRLTGRGRSAAIAIQTAIDAVDAAIAHLITADELHGWRAGLAAYRVIRERQ